MLALGGAFLYVCSDERGKAGALFFGLKRAGSVPPVGGADPAVALLSFVSGFRPVPLPCGFSLLSC